LQFIWILKLLNIFYCTISNDIEKKHLYKIIYKFSNIWFVIWKFGSDGGGGKIIVGV
jgi:hypothetical protein